MADITVVIISYDRPKVLERLLSRLHEQTIQPEVIISDDGTPLMHLPEFYEPMISRLLWSRHTTYQRVARVNEGMAAVETPYAILLDDDQLPQFPQFVQEYRESLDRAPIVRGLGIDERGLVAQPTWWSTANLGIQTAAWRTLVGLDPKYNGNYGYEDLDFGRKVLATQTKWIWGSHHTVCNHLGKPYSGDRDSQEINQKYFYSKWGRDA